MPSEKLADAGWVVWRFPLGAEGNILRMPAGAVPLFVGWQRGGPQMWALVQPEAPKETRRFYLTGTGYPIPLAILRHIGSMIADDGFHVFHVFEAPWELEGDHA